MELQRFFWFSLVLVLGAASGARATELSYVLPDAQGTWALPAGVRIGRTPSAPIEVKIRDAGTFLVDPSEVRTLRPDLFRPGHFSVFDLVAHLAEQGKIRMTYRFDPAMSTYIIESLNERGMVVRRPLPRRRVRTDYGADGPLPGEGRNENPRLPGAA